jgi:O-antigen/teichoic acid export membrane protein
VFIVFLLFKIKYGRLFSVKAEKVTPHLVRFFRYGYAMVIFNALSMFLLAGDRLLINWFDGSSHLGIYNQTYNIAQLTITALFGVVNAAINPFVLPLLERKDSRVNQKIIKAFNITVIAILPVTTVLSIFSKDISTILLGPDFRDMWEYLPFVFFGAFMLGASHLAIIKLKFLMKTKQLIRIVFWAFIINLTTNLILIPIYGYKIATVTTLISYLFQMLALMRAAETGVFSIKNILNNLLILMFSVFVIYVSHRVFLSLSLFDFQYGFIVEIVVLLVLGYVINARKIFLLWTD